MIIMQDIDCNSQQFIQQNTLIQRVLTCILQTV